jgi:hypothetical protein
MSAARRLALLGCLLAAAAPALSGCGGSGAATAESTAAAGPRAGTGTKPSSPGPSTGGCPAQVSGFVKSLDALRRRLAVGLSYEQYAAKVEALREDYDQLPIDRLAIDCVTATGAPAERAFNKYIDAANAWGACLADASCTTASIEPVLQRGWRLASAWLSKAG